jgi:pimeloyl-ACP methyl ester carboxylesterase
MGEERLVPANGITLCVETFGRADDPAVLLIAGMSSSMDWWEDGFCELLAAGGRYVVRYDLRDTGRSTTYPPGEPGYTGADLRADALALLDELGVARAHLVGISMGGAMAQGIAVEHPDRVLTLTLLSTSAGLDGGGPGLPPMEDELVDHLRRAAEQPAPDPSDVPATVERLVEDQRAFMRAGFDDARVRAICQRVVHRSTDLAAAGNHALLETGPEPAGNLGDIAAPTLVVHGSADPMFPLPHGQALADVVPRAELLVLDGVGHEPPPPSTWPTVVRRLLEHTAAPAGSGL